MATTTTDIDWNLWCGKGIAAADIDPTVAAILNGVLCKQLGKGSESGDGAAVNPQVTYASNITGQTVQALIVPAAMVAIMSIVYNSIDAVRSRPVVLALLEGFVSGFSVYNRFGALRDELLAVPFQNMHADPTKNKAATTLGSLLSRQMEAAATQVMKRTAVATGVAVAAASYGMHFSSGFGQAVPPMRERVAHGLALAYVTTLTSVGGLYLFSK